MEEAYATGRCNRHLSDEGVPKTSYVSRSQLKLTYGPGEPVLHAAGEVRVVEEGSNPYVIT